mmetsp:Transcript_41130/g.96580  ORF Transcript_41130/g.96580 Transcript_41130/m.96580 type:complete len:93 (+) Transcript_41130:2-280(+)
MSKYKVEIIFNSSSIGMQLEAGNCEAGEDGVAVYHEHDVMSFTISAGQVVFMENDEPFSTYTLPDESLTMGTGKMSLCGRNGVEGQIEFLTM